MKAQRLQKKAEKEGAALPARVSPGRLPGREICIPHAHTFMSDLALNL